MNDQGIFFNAVKEGLFLHQTDTKSTSQPHNSTIDGEKNTIFLPWCDKKQKFTT